MFSSLSRRLFITTAAASGVVLGAASCSDPTAGGGSAGGGEKKSWPAATTKLDGVELTFWAAQSSAEIPAGVIKGFEKATGAKIKVVSMPDPYEHSVQTKVATGDKPDLSFWQPTASQLTVLNAKQNLQPLDGAPFVDTYEGELKDVTGLLENVRYAALISSPAAMGMFYSKTLFKEQGIDSVPKSWDEMLQIARQLKKDGKVPFFEMGGDMWATQWWVQVQLADAAKNGLWEKVNTKKDTFTGKDIQGAINTFQDLIKEGLFNDDIATASFEDEAKALLEGKAAMSAQITALADQALTLSSAEEIDAKLGFFPISAQGATPTFHPDQANAIVAYASGDEKKEAAARQFLVYWLTDGYQAFIEERSLPSIVKGVKSPAKLPKLMNELADSMKGAQGSMQAQAVANPDLAMNLQKMVQGTMTPEQVGEETQKQFEQLAQAAGAKGF